MNTNTVEFNNNNKFKLDEADTYSQIVNTMTEGAYFIRVSDGIILYTNPSFDTMFGYDSGEMIGQHVAIVNAPTDIDPVEAVKVIGAQILKTGSWCGDVNNIKKDGTPFWCSASVTTFTHPEHGDIWVAVHTDITNKRLVDDALRRSQKMDALGKLTGGIAHDYNNMLGVILGYSELLYDKLDNNPKLIKYASEIKNAGLRGAKLTNKLLNFSRNRLENTEAVDFKLLMYDEINMLEKTLTPRIKLNLDLPDNLWPIYLDKNNLEDAILNVSINSMHAIDGNGSLSIQAHNKNINIEEASLLSINIGDYVSISFTDTGCGMEHDEIEKIFDPFYSTKGELGTGLGLSQVYGLVKQSGGAVKVESEINKGTCLTFYFPRSKETPKANNTEEQELVAENSANGTILLVDDESSLLALNKEILENSGYNIFCAQNAKDALDLLKKHPVDVLFSDIIMPEMNGYELALIVKEKYPSTEIQLVSGYRKANNEESVEHDLQKNTLSKPVSSKLLLQTISDLLNKNNS